MNFGVGTRSFYDDLPLLEEFLDVTDPTRYSPVPDDWLIAATDVQGSTEAIRRGKVITGKFLIRLKRKIRANDWGRYPTELAENTDCRKFSDIFRQVLSGNEGQRLELEKYLGDLCGKGSLVYGTHAAPTALLTCMIFLYNGAHMHLVDGGNGGYALAAAGLKERMKNLHASAPDFRGLQ